MVNAEGAMLPDRLRDIWERVQEIAYHGVRHGAAAAFAQAQPCPGCNLCHLHQSKSAACAATTASVEDFTDGSKSVAVTVDPREIVQKVFDS